MRPKYNTTIRTNADTVSLQIHHISKEFNKWLYDTPYPHGHLTIRSEQANPGLEGFDHWDVFLHDDQTIEKNTKDPATFSKILRKAIKATARAFLKSRESEPNPWKTTPIPDTWKTTYIQDTIKYETKRTPLSVRLRIQMQSEDFTKWLSNNPYEHYHRRDGYTTYVMSTTGPEFVALDQGGDYELNLRGINKSCDFNVIIILCGHLRTDSLSIEKNIIEDIKLAANAFLKSRTPPADSDIGIGTCIPDAIAFSTKVDINTNLVTFQIQYQSEDFSKWLNFNSYEHWTTKFIFKIVIDSYSHPNFSTQSGNYSLFLRGSDKSSDNDAVIINYAILCDDPPTNEKIIIETITAAATACAESPVQSAQQSARGRSDRVRQD